MQASDIYSLAIVCWLMLSGGDTFFQMNEGQLYMQIVERKRRPKIPDGANVELRTMIESWWDPLPAARPSSDTILADLVDLYNRGI